MSTDLHETPQLWLLLVISTEIGALGRIWAVMLRHAMLSLMQAEGARGPANTSISLTELFSCARQINANACSMRKLNLRPQVQLLRCLQVPDTSLLVVSKPG